MNKKKKILIISISVLSIIALVTGLLCYYLVIVPNKEHEKNLKLIQEYYNNKVALFEEENKTLSDVGVVFIGDSLTDGCDLSKYYSEYNAVNRGIAGDTTFGVEKRLKVSLYDVNPDTIVLLIGGNNMDTMFDNYESILTQIKTNLPSSNVVLVSLSAMGRDFKDKNEKAMQNNQIIKSLATKHGFDFVDIFTPLYDVNTGEIHPEYTSDGVHFTDAGYVVVSTEIKKVLSTL